VKVIRTATLGSRVDEVFRRRGGGWYVISGDRLWDHDGGIALATL
jgi:hypothetical protein